MNQPAQPGQQGAVINMYTYENAGFDPFMLRSIDSQQTGNLDAMGSGGGSAVKQLDLDRMQSSGSFGDTVTIGNITINGVDGKIAIADDSGNEVMVMGKIND